MINSFKKYFKQKKINFLCKKYYIENYTINEDMSVDVNQSISLFNLKVNKLPINFKTINGYFDCSHNELVSLEGFPKVINNHSFECSNNKLTSLEGMPYIVNGDIYCRDNYIINFKGIQEDFIGRLFCIGNPIYEIYKLFGTNSRSIYWINEYDVIQGNNIILDRLEEVFIHLGMEIPEIDEIEGYKLI